MIPPIAYGIALGRCWPLGELYSFGYEAGPEAPRHCHWVTAIRLDHADMGDTDRGAFGQLLSDLAGRIGFAVGSGLGLEPEDDKQVSTFCSRENLTIQEE